MQIDVSDEADLPAQAYDLVALAEFVMTAMHLHPDSELSLLLVPPDVMADLHVEWMDEPGPTDVLSFPMDELVPGTADSPSGPGLLGDVVLCPAVARDQAVLAGHDTQQELRILLTHGILHLLGYDHAEAADERVMFDLQRRLVADYDAVTGLGRAGGHHL